MHFATLNGPDSLRNQLEYYLGLLYNHNVRVLLSTK